MKHDHNTVQKRKFSFKDLFNKYVQIRSFMQIWSQLRQKLLMKNFIICSVNLYPEVP